MFKKMPMLQEGWDEMGGLGGSTIYPMSEDKLKIIKSLVRQEVLGQVADFVSSPAAQKLIQLNGGVSQLAAAVRSLDFEDKELVKRLREASVHV